MVEELRISFRFQLSKSTKALTAENASSGEIKVE